MDVLRLLSTNPEFKLLVERHPDFKYLKMEKKSTIEIITSSNIAEFKEEPLLSPSILRANAQSQKQLNQKKKKRRALSGRRRSKAESAEKIKASPHGRKKRAPSAFDLKIDPRASIDSDMLGLLEQNMDSKKFKRIYKDRLAQMKRTKLAPLNNEPKTPPGDKPGMSRKMHFKKV